MSIIKHLQKLIFLMIGLPMLHLCAQPLNLVLRDTTIATAASFTGAKSIAVGPLLTIARTGDATFITGGSMYFRPGIIVAPGGKLRTIRDATLVHVPTSEANIPSQFILQQNYPNPFNPSTTIRYTVKEESRVSLIVFNLLGEPVATLIDKELPAGEYSTQFSPNALPSGVYLYRVTANGFVQSRKMLLLK